MPPHPGMVQERLQGGHRQTLRLPVRRAGRRHRQRFCRSHASCRQGFLPQRNHGGRRPGGLLGPRPDDQRRPLGLLVRLLPGRPPFQPWGHGQGRTENRSSAGFLHGRFLQQGLRHRQPPLHARPSGQTLGSCRRRTRQDGRGLQAGLQVPHRRRRIQCQLHLPARLGSHPAGAQEAQNPLFQKREAFRARQLPDGLFPFRGGQQRQVPRGRLRLDRGDPGLPGRGGHGVVGPENPERLPDQVPGPEHGQGSQEKGALPEHVRLCQPPSAER